MTRTEQNTVQKSEKINELNKYGKTRTRKVRKLPEVELADSKKLREHVGEQIRWRRELKNWSQAKLGEMAGGLSRDTVVRLEQGKGSSMADLGQIARALGTDACLFFPLEAKGIDDIFANLHRMESEQSGGNVNPQEILRDARKKARLTQAAVAELMGVEEGTYGQWERDALSDDYVKVYRLTQVLGLEMRELFPKLEVTKQMMGEYAFLALVGLENWG